MGPYIKHVNKHTRNEFNLINFIKLGLTPFKFTKITQILYPQLQNLKKYSQSMFIIRKSR